MFGIIVDILTTTICFTAYEPYLCLLNNFKFTAHEKKHDYAYIHTNV